VVLTSSSAANVPDLKRRKDGLIGSLTEQYIDPIKGNGAAANDGAGCNCAPENILAREFPDRQERGEHRY
jgi:hypothetical protein